ncbi:hypothetical protein [Cupriavidus basilensis]
MKKLIFIASIAVLLLAGRMSWKHRAPGPDQLPGTALLQSALKAPAAPGVDFEVKLRTAADCSTLKSGAVADVRWHLGSTGAQAVELWVQTGEGTAQLWESGGSDGEKLTGPWTRDGLVFVLVERGTRKLLAAERIDRDRCVPQ